MKALIDADIIMYKCGFSAQHKWYYVYNPLVHDDYWEAKFHKKVEALEYMKGKEGLFLHGEYYIEPLENSLFLCDQLIKRIIRETEAEKYQLYLTGAGNYRDEVATILPYKGGRDNLHKPFWYNEIKEYLITRWGAVVVEGYEADDALSMEQSETNTCICTTDKDLLGTAGWHYNWDKQDKPSWVTEEEARRFFYWQMLTGDKTVDNIPGIPGIGKVGADKILNNCSSEEYECKVGVEYAKAYDDPESAMEENARLLWMSKTKPNDWSWGF